MERGEVHRDEDRTDQQSYQQRNGGPTNENGSSRSRVGVLGDVRVMLGQLLLCVVVRYAGHVESTFCDDAR